MSFSEDNLDTACTYAENAYDHNIVGATKVECARTSTTAFVHRTPHLDIVVFRGTQQMRDWLYNVLSFPRPYKGRLCHAGFVRAHRSVWPEIRKLLDPAKRLLLCGHSLGGALADLSALSCKEFKDAHVITMGKPNVYFQPARNGKMPWMKTQLSVVCGSDAVPRVPRLFSAPMEGRPNSTLITPLGKGHINPSKKFKKEDWRASDSVSDHFMDSYRKCVEAFDKAELPRDRLKI